MGEPESRRLGPEPGPDQVSVCLVEYNPLAARHLHRLLASDHGLQLLSQAEVFKRGRRLGAAVFVLDRGSLPTPLSKLLRVIRIRFRDARVLVLDEPQPHGELFRLLFLGIQGFLAYDEVDQRLPAAIRSVARGQYCLPEDVLEQYTRYSNRLAWPRAEHGEPLTRAETRILELVKRRLSNKEIGAILKVSESTVKFHLANVFAKLGVTDRDAVLELEDAHTLALMLSEKPK